MNRSENIEELVKARIAAAAEITNANKNAVNPHLKNRYADLAAVLEAIEPIYKHGLSLFHLVEDDGDKVTVTAMLCHSSGQFLSCSLGIKPEKATAQGIGSAITYARRYTATALLGITQEDDDGHAASATPQRPPQQTNRTPQQVTRPPQAEKTGYGAFKQEFLTLLDSCKTQDDLGGLKGKFAYIAQEKKNMGAELYAELVAAYSAKTKEIRGGDE
jgi:hypothetical protein